MDSDNFIKETLEFCRKLEDEFTPNYGMCGFDLTDFEDIIPRQGRYDE